jgi:hypothetical protein
MHEHSAYIICRSQPVSGRVRTKLGSDVDTSSASSSALDWCQNASSGSNIGIPLLLTGS